VYLTAVSRPRVDQLPGRVRSTSARAHTPRITSQNSGPQPGSFQACVGGLGATGFTQEAANLIIQISGSQGTSRDLLAVTWMNENNFKPTPGPNTNGYNGDATTQDYMHWDVGPFHINIGYTLAAITNGTAKWPQITRRRILPTVWRVRIHVL
jgi:hypothetical protein